MSIQKRDAAGSGPRLPWKAGQWCAEGKKLKRTGPPEPVVLGEFQVWAMTGDDRHPLYYAQKQLVVAEASSEGARQIYAGGEPCAGDRQRVAIVRPVCAAETKLVRVDEDGVCSLFDGFGDAGGVCRGGRRRRACAI